MIGVKNWTVFALKNEMNILTFDILICHRFKLFSFLIVKKR
jgi:hypothetical protein